MGQFDGLPGTKLTSAMERTRTRWQGRPGAGQTDSWSGRVWKNRKRQRR